MEILTLDCSASQNEFSSSNIQEIEFTVRLTNISGLNLEIYPKIAPFIGVGGWGGPSFGLNFLETSFQELRSYYGPPGQPPNRNFYETNSTLLLPGESHFKTWKTCWIPRDAIPSNSVSKENLDPEGMDAVDENRFQQSSFLVLGKGKDEILKEMNLRADFLRPNLLIVFPGPGNYEFHVSYHQSEWTDFRPKRFLHCRSETAIVTVK
ncbi:hypothetical protein [Leptospira sanjuanensis]|uniref:hypothetical protein n=1 Tax=Leptospira sanjuanensis TaxID=2879643 RepID=UPI001EE7E6AB|nr:hypothetical protein [Leptospira sanjuanensis]MCG6169568.1 hypothetical protein [Leptospira sanjuanensis]